MIWIARLAILFAGFIVGGVMLNVYYAVCIFFSVTLLGVENETFHTALYWACLIAGFATSFFLMRRVWPRCAAATQSIWCCSSTRGILTLTMLV